MILFSPNGEWFWIMCQFFTVAISLFLILRQLRFQRDAHLINSMDILNRRWNSKLMVQARRSLCHEYNPESKSLSHSSIIVCTFFEELGIFLNRKIVDIDIVWDLYSFYIEHYWGMARNGVMVLRREENDNSYYERFEGLYSEIQHYSRSKGFPKHDRATDEIRNFINIELQSTRLIQEAGPRSRDLEIPHVAGEATNNHPLQVETGAEDSQPSKTPPLS